MDVYCDICGTPSEDWELDHDRGELTCPNYRQHVRDDYEAFGPSE